MASTPTIHPFFRRPRLAFGFPVARTASDDATHPNGYSAPLPHQSIAITNVYKSEAVSMRAQPTSQPPAVTAATQSQPPQLHSYSLYHQSDSPYTGTGNNQTAPSTNMTMSSNLEVDMGLASPMKRSSYTSSMSDNNGDQHIPFPSHRHAGHQKVNETVSLCIGFRPTPRTPLPIPNGTHLSHLNLNHTSNTHSHGKNIRAYPSPHRNGHYSLHPEKTQTNAATNNTASFVLPVPCSSEPVSPALSQAPEVDSAQLKRCGWCHTNKTRQWRKGPTHWSIGMTVLCNACGINYSRALKKVNGNEKAINLDQLARFKGLEEHLSITKTIKKQKHARATLGRTAERRSANRFNRFSSGPSSSSSTAATAFSPTTSELSDKRGNVGDGGSETASVNRMSLTYLLSGI